MKKKTTDNERFGVIGGVCPPESLCVFASSPPARAVVSRQPRQAAPTLCAMREVHSVEKIKYK